MSVVQKEAAPQKVFAMEDRTWMAGGELSPRCEDILLVGGAYEK